MTKHIDTRKHMRCALRGILAFMALIGSLAGGGSIQAHAASRQEQLTYYGADLPTMERATGVRLDGTVEQNSPWPQYSTNYCFLAVVQAVVNYEDIEEGLPLRYPRQSDEGPASGNPDDEQPGQILYDMDHFMIPHSGPLQVQGSGASRRPFTLVNIAYDFGGDPRSQAFGTNYEAPSRVKYHEYIYHSSPEAATRGIAQALAHYQKPVIALVNHAEHSVIVAGVWATGNPLTDLDAQISALAVFNPWNLRWGDYLSTSSYEQVSYDDWIHTTNLPSPWGGVTSWFNQPYASNGDLDPDPSLGIYQAGPGTQHPHASYWIGNYVAIQPDHHHVSANFSFNENDQLMYHP